MITVLMAVGFFALAMTGLAVGVLAGRPPIKGSCGGIGCLEGVSCDACAAKREGTAP